VASQEELLARLRRRVAPLVITDEEAADALEAAAEAVRDYCGWHVWPRETVTETVDASGGGLIALSSLMVTDVTAVEYRDAFDHAAQAWQPVASGWDYSEGGWLIRTGCWPDGPRTVRVTYASGYDEPPGALGVVLAGVAARSEKIPTGVRSESAGGESVSYATVGGSEDSGADGMLTAAERRVLDRYRLVNRP
jgi:hypothetical protein